MKILIDMNLSPAWRGVFAGAGWESEHWIEVGDPSAPDSVIMEWARTHRSIVFTHDLDFGALLAATGASEPSVVQLRCEDTRPSTMGELLVSALRAHESDLANGALMTVDPRRKRITLLPLKNSG
jgi:predicted nuclease of predicted toxin-antitoxin system